MDVFMETSLLTHSESADPSMARLRIDAGNRADYRVEPKLFGKFCEHLGRNIYHGMDAGVLVNPTFGHWPFSAGTHHPDGGAIAEQDEDRILARIQAYCDRYELPAPRRHWEAYFDAIAFGWLPYDDTGDTVWSPDTGPNADRVQRVTLRESGRNGVVQFGYLPLHRTRTYEFRVRIRSPDGGTCRLSIHTVDGDADDQSARIGDVVASESIALRNDWTLTEGELAIPAEAPIGSDDLAAVSVTAEGPVDLIVDRVLLYPDDHVNRADSEVIELLSDAELPILRWPGGNFVSGYRWRDGVGPVRERPTTDNPAWDGVEPNLFGTQEFMAFCEEIGAEPMICVNAGDGTPEEAARWVEYCNGSTDTRMGQLRAEHGHPRPYDVTYWEIGNELFGTWQTHWTTPAGNADRYRRFREAMLDVDPSIEVSAVGNRNSPDDAWNDRLIETAGDELETITDHVLAGGTVDSGTDPNELFEAFMSYSRQLNEEYANLRKRMRAAGIDAPKLAITELQLFAHFETNREIATHGSKLSPETMPTPKTISEALYFATVVNECIRLGQFVDLLTHTATVNHGGGLQKHRGHTWANPVHYGRKLVQSLAGGRPVHVDLECTTIETNRSFGDIEAVEGVPTIDALAAVTEDERDLVVVLVNRTSGREPIETTLTVEGVDVGTDATMTRLAADGMDVKNTYEEPERVVPESHDFTMDGGGCELTLEPYSLVRLRVPIEASA